MLKSGSRLRWLASELLVVVLGILIALAVNDFVTSLRDRNLEREYVERIRADVATSLELWQSVRTIVRAKHQALDSIAPVVRGKEPMPKDPESLGRFLRNVGLGGQLGVARPVVGVDDTFEDLRSTGNLRLIRDATVRRRIANYFRANERLSDALQARQTAYPQFVHAFLPAELRGNFNIAAVSNFGIDRALAAFSSEEFRKLLDQEYNFTFYLEYVDQTHDDSTRALLKVLDEYLERLRGARLFN